MASTRKSRIVSKRFSKVNEESPDKDGGNATKSKIRKRKLSDMLGSQWSKEDLERFHEGYRKFGKDWKKVSGTIRNRSLDMVEALYNMNKAYLSLSEGETTAAGLIAMMTDHYNILEGSDSDRERNDGLRTSCKPQKRWREKFKGNVSKGADGSYPDLLRYQSASSSYGCLSLLKKKRSGGSRPRAVGKRTPRFPVSYTYDRDDKEKFVSPSKQGLKSEGDAADDEGAHVAALALAEASQRGGSPQVSRTPGKRTDLRSSPIQSNERKHAESHIANSTFMGAAMDDDCLEGSLGSREAENGDFVRNSSYLLDSESTDAVETQRKDKKFQGKRSKTLRVENNQLDDVKEACSGTEEGLSVRHVKDEYETEVTDRKTARSSQGPRKRSRQLFCEDESTALDALQTLADLSLNMLLPDSTVESESSVQVKEEKKNAEVVEKPSVPETISTNNQRNKVSGNKNKGSPSTAGVDAVTRKNSRLQKGLLLDANTSSEAKHQPHQSLSKMKKRKRKPLVGKVLKAEALVDSSPSASPKNEVSIEDGKRSMSKAKRASQIVPLPKQVKSIKPPQNASSTTDQGRTVTDLSESTAQVSTTKQVTLRTKLRSRRKMDLQKALAQKVKFSEVAGDAHPDRCSHSVNSMLVDLKEKLSHCLSSQMLRRWCAFELFYSAIDYPWFAKREFVEYLNHVGLGHVPRLTRVEWGVIRSSLGRPRRLSKQFLQEEREKLEQYRESVRTHYAELRAGVREGLPADLARPLSVGQRVIACHPKTREIHDGSILTVDRNRCRVQFDRPELGVEFVLDIDCMPLNPLENMPDALRRQNLLVDKFCEGFNGTRPYIQPKEWRIGGSMKFAPTENMETADGSCHVASSNYPMNTLMKQAKGDTIDAIVQAKAAANEVAVAAQQAMYSPPCTLAQIQGREADVKALAELTRALDKKEALLIELRHMNEEVSAKQNDGDSIREFEHFRKQYAMVLFQLRDANDQVASALLYLRQRNTYHGNSTPPWLRPLENSRGPIGPPGSFNNSAFLNQDTGGSHVVDIVESSRRRARTMVEVAVQAMSRLKEGEDAFLRVGEALDSKNWHSLADSGISVVKPAPPSESGHGNSTDQDQTTSCILEPTTTVTSPCPKQNISSDGNEPQLPSELISSCVATLFMIQACSERQYPPAEVAQVLDSAVASLQLCCSQNLPIYREIEQYMGIIKNQMLALVPTPSTCISTELAIL